MKIKCEECQDLGGWFEFPPKYKDGVWTPCRTCTGKPFPEENNYANFMGAVIPKSKPRKPEQNTIKARLEEVKSRPDDEPNPMTSYGRFRLRAMNFAKDGKPFPNLRHIGWWLLHNLVAHIAIGIMPTKASFEFHDWSSDRLNHQ